VGAAGGEEVAEVTVYREDVVVARKYIYKFCVAKKYVLRLSKISLHKVKRLHI